MWSWKRRGLAAAVALTLLLSIASTVAASGQKRRASIQNETASLERKIRAQAAVIEGMAPEIASSRANLQDLRDSFVDRESELVRLMERLSSSGPDSVSVIASGRVEGSPDVMRVTLGVDVEAPTIREAMTRANDSAAKMIRALKSQGVAQKDIQTESLYAHRFDHRPNGAAGYRVGNSLMVKIRNTTRAGDIISAVIEAGGENAVLSGVDFDVEENSRYLKTARSAAMRLAKEKAQEYAAESRRTLGRIIRVSELTSSQPPPLDGSMRTAAQGAEAIPVEPGGSETFVKILVVFLLE